MSLAKLTSISTQTLSLLLERQRVQTLPSFSSPNPSQSNSLHLTQIHKNLKQLKAGVRELEEKEGTSEALLLLRNQYDRMKGMLGPDSEVESLDDSESQRKPLPPSPEPLLPPVPPAKDFEPSFTPYTDDPEGGYESADMLQTQQRLMDEQDEHLDRLSHSIGRQHHISLQINDELDVHTGLLQELDTELDRTENRLTNARRKLDKFARGAKEHASTLTIGLLILILLILIIVFKT